MSSRRTQRASEAIRETVSTAVLFELRDPRIKNVTVLSAEVSGDLRNAKVYVSVMGDMKRQALTMKGLNAARGFIQAKVADRLQTKTTPVLQFVLDQGVKKSIEAAKFLRENLPEGASLPEGATADEAGSAGSDDDDELIFKGSDVESDDDWDDMDESDEELMDEGDERDEELDDRDESSGSSSRS
ncbi:MAG: 30S ribosome-binding factor RbfA [Planctomycetaceae bacterium]|nr:30S ribosome-binding factor RbfA [Planctomycetaceae bacterium]